MIMVGHFSLNDSDLIVTFGCLMEMFFDKIFFNIHFDLKKSPSGLELPLPW